MSSETIQVTTIVLTYRRDEALLRTLGRLEELAGKDSRHEIVLVDNNADGQDRSSLLKGFSRSLYVVLPENRGVTGGRNAGVVAAHGEIMVFVDDDALVETPEDYVSTLIEAFGHDDAAAVIAFRSYLGSDRVSDPAEFPHTDKSLTREERFETFRFIGVGHAFRRSAFLDIGPYREDFFYGMEEFDMSFRLMKRGWKIFYDPSFSVHHLKELGGRLPPLHVTDRMFGNKLKVAWMHLPFIQMTTCMSAWTVKTVMDSRSFSLPFAALAGFIGWAWRNRHTRSPVSPAVLVQIGRMGGKAWR